MERLAIVAAVAFAALLACTPEMDVQLPPLALVRPDVAVDRFMADAEAAVPPQIAGHLLRTPLLLEQPAHPPQVGRREPSIAPGSRPPAAGVPVRQLRAVGAVARRAIALDFPQDGAPMPPEDPGHRGWGQPLAPEQAERISFFEGDLAVRHSRLPLLSENRRLPYPRSPFLLLDFVALSI